jgi:nitrite reductase (NO-forming)/hydroxylamine reductase
MRTSKRYRSTIPATSYSALKLFIAITAALFSLPARAADNKAVYVARCAMCHQSNGQGLSGQFPRIAGRLGPIARDAGGRHYLLRTVLHGMYGNIVVDGQSIIGLMPEFSSISDQDIAAALNHVVGLDKTVKPPLPFKPADVAAVRAEGKVNASANAELRKSLVASGVIK